MNALKIRQVTYKTSAQFIMVQHNSANCYENFQPCFFLKKSARFQLNSYIIIQIFFELGGKNAKKIDWLLSSWRTTGEIVHAHLFLFWQKNIIKFFRLRRVAIILLKENCQCVLLYNIPTRRTDILDWHSSAVYQLKQCRITLKKRKKFVIQIS